MACEMQTCHVNLMPEVMQLRVIFLNSYAGIETARVIDAWISRRAAAPDVRVCTLSMFQVMFRILMQYGHLRLIQIMDMSFQEFHMGVTKRTHRHL